MRCIMYANDPMTCGVCKHFFYGEDTVEWKEFKNGPSANVPAVSPKLF